MFTLRIDKEEFAAQFDDGANQDRIYAARVRAMTDEEWRSVEEKVCDEIYDSMDIRDGLYDYIDHVLHDEEFAL